MVQVLLQVQPLQLLPLPLIVMATLIQLLSLLMVLELAWTLLLLTQETGQQFQVLSASLLLLMIMVEQAQHLHKYV